MFFIISLNFIGFFNLSIHIIIFLNISISSVVTVKFSFANANSRKSNHIYNVFVVQYFCHGARFARVHCFCSPPPLVPSGPIHLHRGGQDMRLAGHNSSLLGVKNTLDPHSFSSTCLRNENCGVGQSSQSTQRRSSTLPPSVRPCLHGIPALTNSVALTSSKQEVTSCQLTRGLH